jgi:hypothetical protein
LLAYFLVAVLIGGEYIFRRYYMWKMGVET